MININKDTAISLSIFCLSVAIVFIAEYLFKVVSTHYEFLHFMFGLAGPFFGYLIIKNFLNSSFFILCWSLGNELFTDYYNYYDTYSMSNHLNFLSTYTTYNHLVFDILGIGAALIIYYKVVRNVRGEALVLRRLKN